MNLAGSWEQHADAWIRWARASPHDGFAAGTWPALRELLPAPGPGPVIDLGCGKGGAAANCSSMHRPLSDYTTALFGQGLAITALTEYGNNVIPWLLAMRAGKLAR